MSISPDRHTGTTSHIHHQKIGTILEHPEFAATLDLLGEISGNQLVSRLVFKFEQRRYFHFELPEIEVAH